MLPNIFCVADCSKSWCTAQHGTQLSPRQQRRLPLGSSSAALLTVSTTRNFHRQQRRPPLGSSFTRSLFACSARSFSGRHVVTPLEQVPILVPTSLTLCGLSPVVAKEGILSGELPPSSTHPSLTDPACETSSRSESAHAVGGVAVHLLQVFCQCGSSARATHFFMNCSRRAALRDWPHYLSSFLFGALVLLLQTSTVWLCWVSVSELSSLCVCTVPSLYFFL